MDDNAGGCTIRAAVCGSHFCDFWNRILELNNAAASVTTGNSMAKFGDPASS
jgi:hypothetical protein